MMAARQRGPTAVSQAEMKAKMENRGLRMVVGTTCGSSVAARQRGPTESILALMTIL
jgi:hypothetical protein